MEALPDLALLHIAANLSGSELAAWCAVSRGWRDRLNDDDLWRHRCDSQMAEYLSQTPCLVQPYFINPQREDTDLSAIGMWRLAFMRETHMWNNWRNNRHHSVLVPDETHLLTHHICDSAPLLTYKNDYLILCDEIEIQLWHVQQTAVKICVGTLPSSGLVRFWDLYGERVVVKQSNQLHIFEISIAKAEFVLKHSVVTSNDGFCPVLLFHSILVELQCDTMQVWNVETGEMLKEEKRGKTNLFWGSNSTNVSESYLALKAIRWYVGEKIQFYFLVYRLPDVVPVFTSKQYDEVVIEAVVLEDVIFIAALKFVDTYCLKTSQLIKRIDTDGVRSNMVKSNHSVFFGDRSGNLIKLTPGPKKVEKVLFQGEMKMPGGISRLSSKYFLLQQLEQLSLLELKDEQVHLVKDLGEFQIHVKAKQVNKVKTKLVIPVIMSLYSQDDDVYRRLEVRSFW